MIQTTVQVSGMACSMCEAHINDAIRAVFPVEKVSSSHSKRSIIMPRKTKASAEEKAQIVEAYLRGEMGLKSAAAKLSVVISTMELWIILYRAEESNAFVQAKRNRCYPPEVKVDTSVLH